MPTRDPRTKCTRSTAHGPTGPETRALRERVLSLYQRGGGRWSSLEDFARAMALPWPDALRLVAETHCTMRLFARIRELENAA